MNKDQPSVLLSNTRLPARLTTEQTAGILGFREHDIAVLTRKRLLTPLGKPVPNAPKYFATCVVQDKAVDADWLNKATTAISHNWAEKNARRNDQTTNN
jgi:hypothetical protein